MVAVPVDAVKLVPNVTGPERMLLLETVKDPVLLTSVVDRERADAVSLPLVIACNEPLIGANDATFNNCE